MMSNDQDPGGDVVEEIGLGPPPVSATHSGSGEEGADGDEHYTTYGFGGYQYTVHNRQIPYIGQMIASVVLLIAITTLKKDAVNVDVKNEGFGIAACIIALLLAICGVALVRNAPLAENVIGTYPYIGTTTYLGGLSYLMFIWWFLTACILTFSGPFLVTSNGYFSSWLGVACATVGIGITPEAMKSQASNLGYLNGVWVASIILICAVPSYIGQGKDYHGESVYALVVGVLSLVCVMMLSVYPDLLGSSMRFQPFIMFAIANWVVMACIVTFRGPFIDTGNGYFSVWVGAILCCMAAAQHQQPHLPQQGNTSDDI